MGLVDYISRNVFAKAKKMSSYVEHFVVATISKIRNSLKQFFEHKPQTLHNLKSILKSNSLTLKWAKSIAPQTPSLNNDNSQIQNMATAPHSPIQNIFCQFHLNLHYHINLLIPTWKHKSRVTRVSIELDGLPEKKRQWKYIWPIWWKFYNTNSNYSKKRTINKTLHYIIISSTN